MSSEFELVRKCGLTSVGGPELLRMLNTLGEGMSITYTKIWDTDDVFHSPTTLSKRLKGFCTYGLAKRNIENIPGEAIQSSYSITEEGRKVITDLDELEKIIEIGKAKVKELNKKPQEANTSLPKELITLDTTRPISSKPEDYLIEKYRGMSIKELTNRILENRASKGTLTSIYYAYRRACSAKTALSPEILPAISNTNMSISQMATATKRPYNAIIEYRGALLNLGDVIKPIIRGQKSRGPIKGEMKIQKDLSYFFNIDSYVKVRGKIHPQQTGYHWGYILLRKETVERLRLADDINILDVGVRNQPYGDIAWYEGRVTMNEYGAQLYVPAGIFRSLGVKPKQDVEIIVKKKPLLDEWGQPVIE